MAATPYYKAFFKGKKVKMVVQEAWITFSLVDQGVGKVNTTLMAEQYQESVSIADIKEKFPISIEGGQKVKSPEAMQERRNVKNPK